MKYLSVCSGIEAASVAWHPLGWKPLAFSEIEKFPRKVLEYHYPNTPLHGDFTLLREQEWIKDADILVGGTPCQAFSVAGLRNSLDDDRGNLTLEFVRLADAIDDLRPTGRGTIIVWENVPGVLSVKDNAFGCFLGAIVGNDAPLIPTGGKWTNAGMVVGPKRRAAWRVLDAQYFGVAQRRRRVFVVASARDGFDPAEVLFEREGLRRDTPPSRQKGQEPSATIAARFGISRNNHEEVVSHTVYEMHGQDSRVRDVGDLSPTVTSKYGTGGGNVPIAARMVAFGEYVDDGTASSMKARDYKDATDLVAQPIIVHGTQDPCVSDIAFAQGRNNGGENVLAQPIPLDTMNIIERPSDERRANRIGRGYGEAGDPMFTITRGNHHSVAQPIAFEPGKLKRLGYGDSEPGLTPSLRANAGDNQVMQSMAVRRLTPRECERLQGFPDDYTAIPGAADGPRYKALGNSMAVPVMAWIGMRIKKYLQSNLDRIL